MANEQNLIPFTSDQSHEEAVKNGRKGGIESGKSKRAKKTFKELVELYGKARLSPNAQLQLKELGFTDEDLIHDMAVVASQYDKAEAEGNTQAATWIRETKEGKLSSKSEVEVSGEVSGITINVKRYDKE